MSIGGGGGIVLAFYAISNISRKKIILGIKNKFFRKTIVGRRDSGNLYPIYKKKIVVLASEPVGGRSRATELPCLPLPYFKSRTRSQKLSFFCMLYLNHNEWQLCHFLHVNDIISLKL